MYEAQTASAILDRMLAKISSTIDKRQGSVTYDMLAPAAVELTQAYSELDVVLDQGFTDTSSGAYLDRRVADYGLKRKTAVAATGTAVFSGMASVTIKAGTIVSTGGEAPIYYTTRNDGTIAAGGTVSISVICSTTGTIGNITPGILNTVVGDLSGVISVTNTVSFVGGVDEEVDEDLRARYFDRASRAVTSGNANHYRQWALEVPGVADAQVTPVWAGKGTVKVVLLGNNRQAPDSAVVSAAQAYIDPTKDGSGQGQAPLGAVATVVAATEVQINIYAKVELSAGATVDDVKVALTAEVKTYLSELAFTGELVRINRIGAILLDDTPVLDHSNLAINNAAANVQIPAGSVAVLGTVTITT